MLVITRTPIRISFLGGGTDYAEFFEPHGGGEVLAAAIDKYCYIKVNTLHDFFEYRLRVSYRKTELLQSIDEVQHPSVRECLKFMKTELPLEIHYMGDLPARTGLGSSSAFTVGLLHALHAYKSEVVGSEILAREANEVEHNWIKERVGYQDQCMAAYGGIKHINFIDKDEINVQPIPLNKNRLKELRGNLMIFYTGITRFAHEILEEQMKKTTNNSNTASLIKMRGLVGEGIKILTDNNRNLSDFGELLHQGWEIKKSLSNSISNPEISNAYDKAVNAGAVGGKLLGAGGGGFLLFVVPPEKQNSVREALAPMKELAFDFAPLGSQVIFYHE